MSTDIDTLGDFLRSAGYFTAYKGKWHLTKEFETANTLDAPEKIFNKEMESYGFSDYFGIGDIIAHTQGGYLHDGMIAAATVNWLRGRATELAKQDQPWFAAVNFVNPHDIMFYNTDRPGEPVQEKHSVTHLARAPAHRAFSADWGCALPQSFYQPIDQPGRPRAHADFLRANDALVGPIPIEDDWRWHAHQNFYLNSLREVDRHIETVLDELDAVGMSSKTIVILTSDHGELGGAHGMSGKGATTYREQNNVPLIVAHPGHPGGARCKAVTTHIDIAPTLVAMTDATAEKKAAITRDMLGRDFSHVLASPGTASVDAVRDGGLFCFNMFLTLDGEFVEKATAMAREPGGKEKIKAGALRPDLTKRGAIRSVFDGRYTFSRYFSPKQHNLPYTLDEIFEYNDVELYDVQQDPNELDNLALDRRENADLIIKMNAKLNELISAEVGEDIGQMLPGGVDAGWAVTEAVHDM